MIPYSFPELDYVFANVIKRGTWEVRTWRDAIAQTTIII